MSNEEKLKAYSIIIDSLKEEDGGGYEAHYPQLMRSITGQGETPQGALNDLLVAGFLFLELLQETKQNLPEPQDIDGFLPFKKGGKVGPSPIPIIRY